MTRKLDFGKVHIMRLDEEMQTWLDQRNLGENSETPDTVCERNIITWLEHQADALRLDYLLAHSDDGITWGRRDGSKIISSHQYFKHVSPPLRMETLQQARLFGPSAELLLWRYGDRKYHARVIADMTSETDEAHGEWRKTEYFDEPQMLWGDTLEEEKSGFTLWREGAQGLRHALPWTLPSPQTPRTDRQLDRAGAEAPPCLYLRHYLADEPAARVYLSRLIGIAPYDLGV